MLTAYRPPGVFSAAILDLGIELGWPIFER